MPYLDVLAEFNGEDWEEVEIWEYPPSPPPKEGEFLHERWLSDELHEEGIAEAFDLPKAGWTEIKYIDQVLRGELYPVGTRVFIRGAQLIGEVSYGEYGNEYVSYWEWSHLVFFEPSDAAKQRYRLAWHVTRTVLAADGVCWKCQDRLINPNPKSEGHKRHLCHRCAKDELLVELDQISKGAVDVNQAC